MKVIFGFPTIENPRIDITNDFWWYIHSSPPPSSPATPAPAAGGALAGVESTLKWKLKMIFGFSTIENSTIDITHDFWWDAPLVPWEGERVLRRLSF